MAGSAAKLAEDLQRADFSDSRGRQHEAETAIQFKITGDESQSLAPQPRDPQL